MTKLITDINGVTRVAGRRSKLTPEVTNALETLLLEGNYVSTAAEALGLHKDTVHRWMLSGGRHISKFHLDSEECSATCTEEDVAFRRLFDTIKRAQAKSISDGLSTIKGHGKTQWQAEAWRLERTKPEMFGMKQRVEHTGEGGGPVLHKFLPVQQRAKILESAQKALQTELAGEIVIDAEEV